MTTFSLPLRAHWLLPELNPGRIPQPLLAIRLKQHATPPNTDAAHDQKKEEDDLYGSVEEDKKTNLSKQRRQANNLLRLRAADLPGYTHHAAPALYKKFLQNSGTVEIKHDHICVAFKKKRNLPALLATMEPMAHVLIAAWENRILVAKGKLGSHIYMP